MIVRLVAAVVLCVLGLPAGVPIVAELAHGFYHFSERLSLDYLLEHHVHSERGFTAGGLDHAHAHAPGTSAHDHGNAASSSDPARAETSWTEPADARDSSPAPDHEHAPAVDALLMAAGGGGGSEIAPPPAPDRGVDLHLPAVAVHHDLLDLRPGFEWAGPGEHFSPPPPALDPPPPRA